MTEIMTNPKKAP